MAHAFYSDDPCDIFVANLLDHLGKPAKSLEATYGLGLCPGADNHLKALKEVVLLHNVHNKHAKQYSSFFGSAPPLYTALS